MANALAGSLENYTYRGKRFKSLIGSSSWKYFVRNIDSIFSFSIGYVPLGFERRPDLISNLFLNTPNLWWVIMRLNHFEDPFEDLPTGRRLRLPIK